MVTDDNAVSDQQKQPAAEEQAGAVEAMKESKDKSDTHTASAKEITEAEQSELEKLTEKLQKAEEKAATHWDEVLRAKAELENTRRRMERDVQNAHKFAVEKFLQDLLPVIDSLEMGIKAANETSADIEKVKEGTELTLKMLNDCTQKFGIEAIDPVGKPFDPEYHQAMSMIEDHKHPTNTVIAVMQKGYVLNGRLVRPAMVVVSKPGESSEQSVKETGEKEAVEKKKAPDSGNQGEKA